MTPATVLIADDHPLFRSGLRQAVEQAGPYRVIAEAGDGDSAMMQIERHAPAVAFVDLAMPGKDGLAVAQWCMQRENGPHVIIMTLYKEREYVDRAVALGASGYLVKDDAQGEIARCLDHVAAGEFYISPAAGIANSQPPALAANATAQAAVARLTQAQRDVLKLVADFRTSKEIARALNVSPKTIENHRANMSTTLDLRGANALLRFAVANRSVL